MAPDMMSSPTLSRIYCGGEMFPATLAQSLRKSGSVRVFNCYGLTETAIDALIGEVRDDRDIGRNSALLGTSVPGAEISVVHKDGTLAYPGVVGELCVGGAVLARGYLHDPRLTASRFRPDPNGERVGARVLMTGDQVRLLARGHLEYLGRLDDEVKILGHRFHPIEVESVLESIAGISQAIVGKIGGSSDNALLAAVTLQESAQPAIPDVRRYLRERLPAALVPRNVVVLKHIPRLDSGKVDRKASMAAAVGTISRESSKLVCEGQDATLAAPLQRMIEVTEDLLGLTPRSSLDEDFVALGGDSIRAARLVHAVRREFDQPVDVGSLLAADSVLTWLRGIVASTAGSTN
jgi:acyl-coenzyme A synthetase/AMP-(fatty) acid ligase/aryl carrier-like protein